MGQLFDDGISKIVKYVEIAELDTSKVYVLKMELCDDANRDTVMQTLQRFANVLSANGIKAIIVPHREGFPFEIKSIEVKDEQ